MMATAQSELRPIGTVTIETRTIVNRLALCECGDMVNYRELSELIGRDVQGPGRSALESARRILLSRERFVFGVILDVGLKRLNNEEIVDTGYRAQQHVKRHAKRSIRVLLAAEYDSLSVARQAKLNGFLMGMKLHEFVATEKTMKRIEGAAATSAKQLSLKETIEAFRD